MRIFWFFKIDQNSLRILGFQGFSENIYTLFINYIIIREAIRQINNIAYLHLTSYGNFVISSGGGWGWSLPLQTFLILALTIEVFGSQGSRVRGWLSVHLLHIQWVSAPESCFGIWGCKHACFSFIKTTILYFYQISFFKNHSNHCFCNVKD